MKSNGADATDMQLRAREVLRAEDFSEDDLTAIAAANVPDDYVYLDAELEDWKA